MDYDWFKLFPIILGCIQYTRIGKEFYPGCIMLFPIILGCIQYTVLLETVIRSLNVISHYLGMYSIYFCPTQGKRGAYCSLFPIILGCIQYTNILLDLKEIINLLFPIILGCIQYTIRESC